MRRFLAQNEQDREKLDEIKIEDYKTVKGYYSIPNDLWNQLDQSSQDKIKNFNGKLRKTRKSMERATNDEKAITQRRGEVVIEIPLKRTRTVEIRDEINNSQPTEEKDADESRKETDSIGPPITNCREVIRFQVNGNSSE